MPVYVLVAAAAVASAAPLLWWSLASSRPRSQAIVATNLAATRTTMDLRQAVLAGSAQERAVKPAVRWLTGKARRFTPAGVIAKLDRRLTLAGRPRNWPLERLLAAKIVLAVAGLLAGPAILPGGLIVTLAATSLGYFAPELILRGRGSTRQKLIRQELADTIDQITIAVEAGLGFEAAMARAARSGTGPLAEELMRTLQEVQIGIARREALRALVDRTDVQDLRSFVFALLQAETYGVPIVEVLRIQSAELRVRRRQRAEERAMKIPVKIVFPLVLCIMPALFIVILGPSVIGLIRVLGSS
jgi:tight adherence protein C